MKPSFRYPCGVQGSVIPRKWITSSNRELSKHLFARPKGKRTIMASLAGSEGTATAFLSRQLRSNPPWWPYLDILYEMEPRTRGKERSVCEQGDKTGKRDWVGRINYYCSEGRRTKYLAVNKRPTGTSRPLGSPPPWQEIYVLMNLRAGHRHSSLVREESQPTVSLLYYLGAWLH